MRCGNLLCWLTAGALCLSAAVRGGDKAGDDKQAKEELAAVKAYLDKTKPGKKWDSGPTRIDSAAIRKAYPQDRFYQVFSTVPGPLVTGIKPSPQLVAAHAQASADKMKNSISWTVRIDPQGKVSAVDYNAGLMPVPSASAAQVAAAAILSLHQEGDGPVHVSLAPVAAKDVQVVQSAKGWSCTAPLASCNLGFAGVWGGSGTVTFDANGMVTAVAKQVRQVAPYRGPYPPAAKK